MMHPKIVYPGHLKPIIDDLAQPLHDTCARDRNRTCRAGEISLEGGFYLDFGAFAAEPHVDIVLDDFRRFMTTVMDVSEKSDGFSIRAEQMKVSGAPDEAAESYCLNTSRDECLVQAADMDGLRRALFRLEDEMFLRRAPLLPIGKTTRWTRLVPRIIRSPIAPYRWLTGWELTDANDYYPDAYLNRLAHYGINALWIPGLLRDLVSSKVIPELGPAEHRLDKLKSIVAKCARYGIRIYLFCIEPRALPPGHPAFVAHPEIMGIPAGANYTLCSSEPLVLDYIREVTQALFTEVPELAGMINIFCGERPTTCHWRNEDNAAGCAKCGKRTQADVLSEVLNTFTDGIRAAGSTAEFMAWSYFIGSNRETSPIAPLLKVMEKTNADVIWLGNFEHGSEKELCGKKVKLHEYSLSCLGPSPDFVDMSRKAAETRHAIYAKLQMGTSYELSSVPHIPVPGIEYEKILLARDLGVTGSMLTWIPGGFPSVMLKAAGEAAFEPGPGKSEFLQRLAALYWGESSAPAIVEAWEVFAQVWQRYPFAHDGLYWGPITRGPSYQLHLEREERRAKPYNWGYTRKREFQPWEDQVSLWLGPFTASELINSFRSMAEGWRRGLDKLRSVQRPIGNESELQRQVAVAAAIRLHFLSAANVIEFYTLRDGLLSTDDKQRLESVKRMQEVARDDIEVAEEMKTLLVLEPTLGFENELFDFSYSRSLLDQKILQVTDMLPVLARWEQQGVDPKVLETTVEEAENLRPDRDPDRWGD